MKNPFEKANDWPAEAKHGGYRVRQVAMHLGISVRWLEMYFKKRFGKRPRELFAKWREREIRRLAAEGKTGKEMLDEVRLSHCSSLSRSLSRDGKSGLRELKRDTGGGGYSVLWAVHPATPPLTPLRKRPSHESQLQNVLERARPRAQKLSRWLRDKKLQALRSNEPCCARGRAHSGSAA